VGAEGRALVVTRQKSKGKNCFENRGIKRLECGTNTTVGTVHKLVLRAVVSETLH
jgi:hypothetical protein